MTEQAENRRYYDAESDHRLAEGVSGERVEKRTEFIARYGHLAAQGDRRLLEVGMGPGVDARAFDQAGFDVVGLDLSTKNAANALRGGVASVAASAARIPLRDHSVSLVWSLSALMHLDDQAVQDALEEIQRVARPDAAIVIAAWGGEDTHEPQDTRFGRRYFHRRSNQTWTEMVTAHLGPMSHWETWPSPLGDGWAYQWAEWHRQGAGD